jgi:uncharacterized protein (TIGR04145 family)
MSTLKKFLFSFLIAAAVVCAAFLPAQKVGATPYSDWEKQGYPTTYWQTDNFTHHRVGFVNDPKHKCFKLLVEISPNTEFNKEGYKGGYNKLQPSGYDIKMGDTTYTLDLKVNPWSLQDGQSQNCGIGVWDPRNNRYNESADQCAAYSDEKGHQSAYVTIPYSMFDEADLNDASTVSIRNNSLTTEPLTISGASTGPWLLAAAAVLIAAPAVAVATRKQRKGVAHER